MECPRCQGFMTPSLFEDLHDDTGSLSFSAWRCVACGEVLDPVIAANRSKHCRPMLGRSRKKFAASLR